MSKISAWFAFACVAMVICSGPLGATSDAGRLEIGSRLELFVDDWLIDRMEGTRLVLQRPVDAGKIFDLNLPWEGPLSGIPCVFKDGDKYRMYYRGARRLMQKGRPGSSNICYAESADGIHWTKPNLGIYEFAGAKSAFTRFLVKPYDKKPEIRIRENNITYLGDGTPQWHCFKDENPEADPQRRYKAICGITLGYGGPKGVMSSPDGLHWEWWRKEPIFVGGPMDTQNLTLWDPVSKQYMAFLRNWVSGKKGFAVPPEVDAPPKEYNSWYAEGDRVRAITLSTSKDYLHWSRQQWLIYSEGTPLEHLYTNGVTKYFRAPHMFLGFPERFVHDRVALEGWVGSAAARGKGLDDVLFMSSRDGLHWDRRFREAFIRPGPERLNWVDHGNMAVAPGVVQTGPAEVSLYYVAHYNSDSIHLRRCTLRLDGFVSVNADYAGGEFVTKPLVFSGKHLVINYSTSAAGSVAVEIQDAFGKPLPGFALEDCPQIYGDQIERIVAWKKGSDLSSLAGTAVRLRFVLKDADLYSIRFGEKEETVTIEPGQKQRAVATRLKGKTPVVDGKLDRTYLEEGATLDNFQTLDTFAAPEASTAVSLAWNSANLYVVFVCREPMMAKLVANPALKRDERTWEMDCVELFVARDMYSKAFTQFIVSAGGTRYDGRKVAVKEGGVPGYVSEVEQWNPDWSFAVKKGKTTWTAEMVIPMSVLGGPPKPGEVWAMNFCRERQTRPKQELSTWSPLVTSSSEDSFKAVPRFGLITFTD